MMKLIQSIFGKYDFKPFVQEVNNLEKEIEKLSGEELEKESLRLKDSVKSGTSLEDVKDRAFALVREAAKRTLKQRHFDVQLIGGYVLHQGKIAEMTTGEGKTLTATLAAYLNALTAKGVHVVTVNDYLARRDAVWMGQIYHALGISVGCLIHETALMYDPEYVIKQEDDLEQKIEEGRDTTGSFKVYHEYLRPVSRQEAYKLDILYGTNHEFGFDYLRDNLNYRKEDQVQRGHYFAIIDEVDSILIDEARTPLIIAAPDTESSDFYKIFSRIVAQLSLEKDYTVEEKTKSATITDEGITKVESALGIKNLYAPENARLVHFLEESLKAKSLFHRDKQYVVKNGEVIIVDEFTGRLMPGRRYSGGLHQAIEAKEGVHIQQESKTYAQVTIQNYFRMYEKISGMTGTAQTSAEEFDKVYKLEVVTIPTNKPVIRKDAPDVIYKTSAVKYQAIIQDIKERNEKGQPILVGTTSIEKNELLSALLTQEGIAHQMLNAKNHEKEGEIIAQAGKIKAVTVATNMAGRGVDIILGGNPPLPEEGEKVRQLGGLHVIGTERHEARRIDNQLRGRSGRQGDPGSSQFYLSLEDDLMRIFGGERVKKIMETFDFPEEMPLESSMISKVVNEAQKKVEGLNFDARKHLLEYDDVLNKQRTAVYNRRQNILEGDVKKEISEIINNVWKKIEATAQDTESQNKILVDIGVATEEEAEKCKNVPELLDKKLGSLLGPENQNILRVQMLMILDQLWMNHLETLEDLRESVRIRAYGQHDPLVEYRRDSYQFFQKFFDYFEEWIFNSIWKLVSPENIRQNAKSQEGQKEKNLYTDPKIGRNDPCPCGSGKKYKKCHGK